MMYILTEEEIRGLVSMETYRKDTVELEEKLNKAEELILSVSEFVCIHDEKFSSYCDKCPVGAFGINTCRKQQKYSK